MSQQDRQTTASQVAQMDEADLADEQMIKRVDKRLRRDYPEVFDSHGRLRRSAVAQLLRSVGGVRLNRDQVNEVIRLGRAAAARRGRKRQDLNTST
jgi:hypothetical protein